MATTRNREGLRETKSAGKTTRLGLALVVIAVAQVMIVLDTTIVTVALPHIQHALGFSSSGLQWIVTLYALVFGGLLLLGGRIGDVFGRLRMFVAGLVVFSTASLFGGLAQSQVWLLVARVAQGVGAAVIAPAVLALVITNFPEGPERNRATGVYAAMGALGGALGLLVGGVLTTYASWRWTLFVNVPIGLTLAIVAPLVLEESSRQRGRFDLLGALLATTGIGALVYGVSVAAPSGPFDVSHWSSAKVIGALVGAAVLLGSLLVVERSSTNPLMPLRLFADRNRNAGYLTAAVIGGAFFGVLYYLTLFFQEVWGYSAVRSGASFLPWVVTFGASSFVGVRLLPRVGPRPLLISGSFVGAGGLFWLSMIGAHSAFWTEVFGPLVLAAGGFGVAVVSLVILATSGVRAEESGVAASLLNVGQQGGGALTIAVLGTVAWTVAAHRISQHALTRSSVASRLLVHQALAAGFDRAFLVAAGLGLLIVVVAITMVRVGAAPRFAEPVAGAMEPASVEPGLRTTPCGSPVLSKLAARCAPEDRG